MKYLWRIAFYVELLAMWPAFIVCLFIYWFGKDERKTDNFINALIRKKITWIFSAIVWGLLIYWDVR